MYVSLSKVVRMFNFATTQFFFSGFSYLYTWRTRNMKKEKVNLLKLHLHQKGKRTPPPARGRPPSTCQPAAPCQLSGCLQVVCEELSTGPVSALELSHSWRLPFSSSISPPIAACTVCIYIFLLAPDIYNSTSCDWLAVCLYLCCYIERIS